MKTLLFTLEYPPFNGGVANYYYNLTKYWPIEEKIIILDNKNGELNSSDRFLAWWPAIFSLNRKLRVDKFDYLLVGQILPLGIVAYLISWLRPIKYTIFLHGMDLNYALKTTRKHFISQLILKRASKIVCANTYVQSILLDSFPYLSEKTKVINPGIEGGAPALSNYNLDEIKSFYDLQDKVVLFSLGRLVKRKGFDRTIEAIAQMPNELRDKLIYFIAGTGPEREYLRGLVPLELTKKIIFLDEISDSMKWTWLNLCDIFIMPSRDIAGDFEGFGIVYLEANLCGKPVIAGNSGGISDAVVNEVNGLVVDPEKIDEISAAINRLASNKELCFKLGQKGKQRALLDFSWEKQIEKIWQFIK